MELFLYIFISKKFQVVNRSIAQLKNKFVPWKIFEKCHKNGTTET